MVSVELLGVLGHARPVPINDSEFLDFGPSVGALIFGR